MFGISGEIPRVTSFERGLPGHYRRTADGKNWEPDPLIMDERFLATNVAGKGLIVFSGCSHAGIINVLKCAHAETPLTPLYGLFGGMHLVGMNEPIIAETVEAVREFQLSVIAVGHCTGWRATNALTNAFGDQVVAPCAVGKRYAF
jgi:7,8-dihydropterin-6-yl-methyl-4-(beta-D-ribofuranosyl)aminobenzene 5'-phosphate synthase